MMKIPLLIAFAAIVAAPLGRAEAAPINFADHLECRDIKDMAERREYSTSFASNELPFLDGCVVKVPAKQVCWAVKKEGVDPPPFAAPAGTNLNGKYFLCYAMRCERDEQQFILADQLGGARLVTLKPAKTVCVPGY